MMNSSLMMDVVKENVPADPHINSNNCHGTDLSDKLETHSPAAPRSSEQRACNCSALDRDVIGIGLVGNGHRAQKFIRAIEAMPRLKLVACCEINGSSPENVPVFKSVDEMIAQIPFDIGIICIPHEEHFAVCRTLLEHGIHVLKEKPFALSLTEAGELHSLARKRNLKLMISTQRRFSQAYVRCKEMLCDGVLGSISCIDVRYTIDAVFPSAGNWRTKKSADIVIDMGYHMLDLITWLFGVPEEIYCLTNEQNHYEVVEAGDVSSITFSKLLTGGKTAVGNIFLARHFHEKQENLTIIGTKGSIVIKDGQTIKHLDSERKLISEEHFDDEPVQSVLQHFLETIDTDAQSPLASSLTSEQMLTMKFVDALQNNVKSS